MKLKNFAIITLILFAFNTIAQNKVTDKGNEAFEKGYWNAAIENYKLALKKEKDNELKMLITYRTAIAYEKSRDYANAINWYLKVIKKGGAFLDKNPEAFLNIANSYKAIENFELAIDNYKTYNIALPNDPRGNLTLDALGNPIMDIYIRKVEKVDGNLRNVVIKTYPAVSQFWTYKTKDFLANPVYSRDYPPANNLEK